MFIYLSLLVIYYCVASYPNIKLLERIILFYLVILRVKNSDRAAQIDCPAWCPWGHLVVGSWQIVWSGKSSQFRLHICTMSG